MMSQEVDRELVNQLEENISFLEKDKFDVQEELINLHLSIKSLEERIIEIDSRLLANSNTTDINTDLFSPSKKNERSNNNKKLNQEIKSIDAEITDNKNKLQKLSNRERNLTWTVKYLQQQVKLCSMKQDESKNDIIAIRNKVIAKQSIGINVLETQENERKRIARDLHDSTAQNLTGMMHKTELCTKLIDMDPIRAKLELQTMILTLKTTLNDMRNTIYNLRPMSIDDLGLVATIERYINERNSFYESNILTLRVHSEELKVIPVINLTLFRIVQEASSNSYKHGKATKIEIDLEYTDQFIKLTISDNGIGFNQDNYKEVNKNIFSGFGLSIMKERVLLLTGEIDIRSSEDNGTIIEIVVPISTVKEDM